MATKQDAVTAQNLTTERATKALDIASQGLEKVVATVVASLGKEVGTATAALTTLTDQVADKQAQLNSLEKEYTQKADDAAYDLKIKVRDNEEGTLRELLRKNDLATIKTADLANLTREVQALKADNSEALQEAVNVAVEQAEAKAAVELTEVRAENKVQMAQYTAQAVSDANTIKLLQAQLTQARDDISAERKARVDVEQYRSQASGVTVNTVK
jgi:hypothetical protein